MKKIILTATALLATAFALTGCKSSSTTKKDSKTTNKTEQKTTTKKVTHVINPSSQSSTDFGSTFAVSPEKLIITLTRSSYNLESDGWVGIVPTGTKYTTELQADEVDILYSYAVDYDFDGATLYTFEFELESLKTLNESRYDVVVCNTDSPEDDGRVLYQFGIEFKNNTIQAIFDSNK